MLVKYKELEYVLFLTEKLLEAKDQASQDEFLVRLKEAEEEFLKVKGVKPSAFVRQLLQ